MTEQKIKTATEIYSRDGIMIYQNGFRIAECENEEAADQILQALSRFSSPMSAVIMQDGTYYIAENDLQAKEYENNPDWLVTIPYPKIESISSPQEVSDEALREAFKAGGEIIMDYDIGSEENYERHKYPDYETWMRSRLNK